LLGTFKSVIELEKAIEDAFLERNTDKLSEDELREILANKGLSAIEIKRAIHEAVRDCVLSEALMKDEKYELITREERERELE
jgi:hypothetical protein